MSGRYAALLFPPQPRQSRNHTAHAPSGVPDHLFRQPLNQRFPNTAADRNVADVRHVNKFPALVCALN